MTGVVNNDKLPSTTKTDIVFDCYAWRDKDGLVTLFQFWPSGIWDESKHTLLEALDAYPPTEYNWIKAEDDE